MRPRLLALGLLAVVACQSGADEDVGVIMLGLAAGPPNTACLRVTVTGSSGTTAVRSLALTPGSSTTGTLPGLPLGQVSVKAEAFSAACAAVTATSVPTWVSDPVSVILISGAPVAVKLVMQRAGQISVSVDWNNGGAGGGGGVGGGAGGRGGSPLDVAKPLNGFLFTAPCLADTSAAVCTTLLGACPGPNADRALTGVLLTDKTVTLGGTAGTPYTVTLHVQGEVESKQYMGSIDAESMLTSPHANGFATGGTPTTADFYGVYLIRVTNPDGTVTNYYLNSLQGPGVSNHTTYGIDYVASIQAQGGATIRLVASDGNCSMIKNCGPTVNDGSVCAAPITLTTVDPTAIASNPTFNFFTPYNGQWIALTVQNVTSP